MFRSILVSAFLVLAVGCGGVETPDDAGSDALAQQDKTTLATSCEQIQYRGCSPFSEVPCVFSNGAQGWCYCQDIPFNQWQCTTEF
ncbi:MAG TPA: hypothetical protein VFZ09_21265 [Archangium sp.]|uniref:hypothetical protein n=1 Tax=Archangium sp. TaxID=1872627 RepID=UPI002E32ED57|nr:hypothetical protein [Archangium sp.]HEX5748785.1 hypothetical protein [Archangium sp.]